MSKLYIAEFLAAPKASIALVPPITGQILNFTASTVSAAFNDYTAFIRVVADADCHLEFAATPTATTSSVIKISAGQPEYFGVTPGQKVAVIVAV